MCVSVRVSVCVCVCIFFFFFFFHFLLFFFSSSPLSKCISVCKCNGVLRAHRSVEARGPGGPRATASAPLLLRYLSRTLPLPTQPPPALLALISLAALPPLLRSSRLALNARADDGAGVFALAVAGTWADAVRLADAGADALGGSGALKKNCRTPSPPSSSPSSSSLRKKGERIEEDGDSGDGGDAGSGLAAENGAGDGDASGGSGAEVSTGAAAVSPSPLPPPPSPQPSPQSPPPTPPSAKSSPPSPPLPLSSPSSPPPLPLRVVAAVEAEVAVAETGAQGRRARGEPGRPPNFSACALKPSSRARCAADSAAAALAAEDLAAASFAAASSAAASAPAAGVRWSL